MKVKTCFLLLFFTTMFLTSCLTIRPNASAKETNIIPRKRLDRLIMHHIRTNEKTFNWTTDASDRMIYSALMQGEKPILTIGYNVGTNIKWGAFYRENDTLPHNWQAKRDSIVDFIWEKEKIYQDKPNLKKSDLLPYGLENRLPLVKVIVTDPSIIRPLRENKSIRAVEPNNYSFDWRR